MVSFSANYVTAIKWCDFKIKIDDEVIYFSLLMYTREFWELLKYLDLKIGKNLYPRTGSIIFKYGSDKRAEENLVTNKNNIIRAKFLSEKWNWLEDLLAKNGDTNFSCSWCEYYNIILYTNQ